MVKILFADDEETVRNLYSESLQEVDGFEVETASNGSEALQKIDQIKPHLIILDILMPEKSGLEVLKEIKSDPDKKNIPVLMFSGVSDLNTITQCLELGAVGYIQKDEEHEEIMAKIKLLVRLQVKT
jgi:DNA-binding response OmpR family regulator